MKAFYIFFASLLLPGPILAQTGSQQPDSSANSTNLVAEVKALREALLETQKQVAAQQREIETLKTQPLASPATSTSNQIIPIEREASGHDSASSLQPAPAYTAPNLPPQPTRQNQEQRKTEQPPIGSFKFGDAILTLGGFVDFENIFRTTNTQSNIATNYGTIPDNNTAQGRVSEFRTTAQFSRLSAKITDSFHGNDVTGYIEGDFSGNDAPGVYQSVNPHTNRLRLYFMTLKRGKWEFLAGQTWSWLTPNRTGIGPMPPDLAITYNEDQNLGVGVPYTRAAEFRVAYHPNEHWALGVGIENSNQYIGNYVALPSHFTAIGSQFDNGANAGAANLMPDILSKITYDRDFSGRHFHAEVTGLFTGAQASAMPIGSTSFKTHSTFGGGGQIATNYELRPKLLFLANAFWSDGGAHYLVATGPQLVVRPNPAGTDVRLSMVHAGAGSAGIEWIASEKEAFAAYYGADYFGRNFFPDTTNTTNPGNIIGFGGPGSPNTNNRVIQQVTFDWLQTFWKNPRYGALHLRSVFLPDACSMVCSSRHSQERTPEYGLLRLPLHFAIDFRHLAPCAISELTMRYEALETTFSFAAPTAESKKGNKECLKHQAPSHPALRKFPAAWIFLIGNV